MSLLTFEPVHLVHARLENDLPAGEARGRYIIGVQLMSPMLLMAMSGTY